LAEAVQMDVASLFGELDAPRKATKSPRLAKKAKIAQRTRPPKSHQIKKTSEAKMAKAHSTDKNTTQIMKILQGMDQAKQSLAIAMLRTLNRVK
jgi:hypothetical protein